MKKEDAQVDVCAIGTLAVDYYGLISTLPGSGGKITATSHEVHPGGVAGNVLTQLARLGVRTGWLGKVGDDQTGTIVLDEFSKEGIDSSHSEIIRGEFSMFTWILVDGNGERTIVMFPNILNQFTAQDVVSKHADYIRAAKIFQGEVCALKLSPVVEGLKIAKSAGVTTVLDLDVVPSHFIEEAQLGTWEELYTALEITDVLVPCKAAAVELLKTEDIDNNIGELMDYGPGMVAVTLGGRGCIIADRSESIKLPGYPVDIIDTTGAGDAFHGGLIYGLLHDFDKRTAGKIANACGAYCCQQLGARAMGTYQEIEAFMRKNQRPPAEMAPA